MYKKPVLLVTSVRCIKAENSKCKHFPKNLKTLKDLARSNSDQAEAENTSEIIVIVKLFKSILMRNFSSQSNEENNAKIQ